MSVIKRYPHVLCFGEEQEPRTARNEQGDPIELPPTFSGSIECKAVPDSGKGKDVIFDDGIVKRIEFTCYFSPQKHVFKKGERVKLILTTGMEMIMLVAGFIPYQKTHKLWLA